MFKFILISAILVYACVSASPVVVLDDSNFEDSVAEGHWFVKFFAPWCGHCKRMAQTWESFAANAPEGLEVAEVDCTKSKSACTGVAGYPTITLYIDGKASKYQLARTEDAFKEFYHHAIGKVPEVKKEDPIEETDVPGEVIVLTKSNFDSKTAAEGLMLVKFYAPWCGHCKSLAPKWDKLASVSKDAGFKVGKIDCTENGDICKAQKIRGYPTIKLVRDGEWINYSGNRSVDSFVEFVKKNEKTEEE